MAPRARPDGRALLALALVSSGMSCATGAERLVRKTVPATIDETIGAFEDPDTQQRLGRLLELPEVQEAARRLAQSLAQGTLDGLTDAQRLARLRDLSSEYVGAVTRAVGEHLEQDIAPAMTRAVERSVQRALAAALSPEVRRDAGALADALTRRTVRALVDEAGQGLRDDLGPALQAVIEDNLGPAMQHVIREDLTPALRDAVAEGLLPSAGPLAREVSREAVLGLLDALAAPESDERLDRLEARLWRRLDATIDRGIAWGQIAAWALALLVLVLVLLLARSRRIRRDLEQERARSERMLIGLLQASRRSEVPVDRVLEQVRERDPELARSSYITGLVQRAVASARDLLDGDDKPPRA